MWGWGESLKVLLDLREAFARARGLLRLMGEGAKVPIEPREQTVLADATAALPGVLCAGVPGAGGVDAIFAVAIHPGAVQGIQALWASWGDARGEGKGAERKGAEKEDEERGSVCPLLLTAASFGTAGGMVETDGLAWD
ncbi:unnamed protein product [Discosporangium mesarthrocarpum]